MSDTNTQNTKTENQNAETPAATPEEKQDKAQEAQNLPPCPPLLSESDLDW